MPATVSRLYRIVRLAFRLAIGEARRGPAAIIEMVRNAVLTIFGRSSLDHNKKSAVVEAVAKASDVPAPPVGSRYRRGIFGSFFTQIGLGLLRQGHVADAAWLLGWAGARRPDHVRLRAAGEVVEGERRVLSGEWRSPPGPSLRIEPEPGRVLHIVGKSLPQTLAGYTVRTQSVVAAQRDAGLDPEVVSRIGFPWYVGGAAESDIEEVDGIRYHRVGGPDVPPRWDDRLDANVEALVPVVERVRPAVLHAHSDFENALLALALRDRFGLPVVYEVRGFWEETWLSGSSARRPEYDRFRWRHEREVACAMAADHVVTLAPTMVRRLVADGVPPSHLTVVPNAVDPVRFPEIGRDADLGAALGIASDEVTVGYVSSLVDYEGVDTLLRAVARLAGSGVAVRALIVGDGAARPDLERLAARLDLGDRAVFTGRVPHDQVLSYYGMIDIFVVPRRNDRVCRLVTPLKPFEAMATGRALVMSGVEALQDIADESNAAVTFTPEDDADLAARLRPLIANPHDRLAMGRRGRDWVRRERTWEENASRYVEIYRRLGGR